MPVAKVSQMPAQQPDFFTIDACFQQAFFFDGDLAIELAPSRLIARAITTQETVQVRQPTRPSRHSVVHKQLLILLKPDCMIAAFSYFTIRNERPVNDINVVNFTCYWDVKLPPPAACGARFARSSAAVRRKP